MTALIIRGGTVVNHDHSRRADVLVDGETIVAIGSPLDAPSGAGVIDAGDCYVMPGAMPVVLTKLCRRLATPAQPVDHHRPTNETPPVLFQAKPKVRQNYRT
jgi:hypothetical protein